MTIHMTTTWQSPRWKNQESWSIQLTRQQLTQATQKWSTVTQQYESLLNKGWCNNNQMKESITKIMTIPIAASERYQVYRSILISTRYSSAAINTTWLPQLPLDWFLEVIELSPDVTLPHCQYCSIALLYSTQETIDSSYFATYRKPDRHISRLNHVTTENCKG